MLAVVILGAGLFLRSAILLRGWRSQILRTYSWFYYYILAGLAGDIIVAIALQTDPHWYAGIYWATQFTTLAFGCAVILEIFRHVLRPYPGAEKFARSVLVATFAVLFLSALIYARMTALAASGSFIEAERDVRTAQVVFLVAILAVILHYGILLGRNMSGMMYGYGLYLSVSLLTLAFRAYAGLGFNPIWRLLQPLSSCLTLSIWLFALWAYHPNPTPNPGITLESDYQALASATKGGVNLLCSYLGRSVRN
jgi:hypothetical protein